MLANAAHQGAVNAMLDAVILGNLIQDLPSASSEHLAEIFKEFQAERYSQAKSQMHLNNKVGKLMSGQVKRKQRHPHMPYPTPLVTTSLLSLPLITNKWLN